MFILKQLRRWKSSGWTLSLWSKWFRIKHWAACFSSASAITPLAKATSIVLTASRYTHGFRNSFWCVSSILGLYLHPSKYYYVVICIICFLSLTSTLLTKLILMLLTTCCRLSGRNKIRDFYCIHTPVSLCFISPKYYKWFSSDDIYTFYILIISRKSWRKVCFFTFS